MKHTTLKNKIIMLSGIAAGIVVLGLVIFSPSQNASALSVSDEVALRLANVQQPANPEQETVEGFENEEIQPAAVEEQLPIEESYVLSDAEEDEFFRLEYGYVEDPKRIEVAASEEVDAQMAVNNAEAPGAFDEPAASMQFSEGLSGAASTVSGDLDQQENDSSVIGFSSDHRFRGLGYFRNQTTPTPQPTQISESTPEPTEPTQEPTTPPTQEPTAQPQPTQVPTQAPTKAPTAVPTKVPTQEPTPVPTLVPTQVPTNTPTPEPEPTAIPTQDAPDLFWSAGFENGDLSEWTPYGSWLRQGNTATYDIQQSIVHSGDYAIKLTIDTSSGTSQAAYLFFWNNQLPDAAYYSAWYYIPENIDTDVWWNIMQWKSTYDGNTDHSRPMFVLDGAIFNQTALSLCYLPDRDADKKCWKQTDVALPKNQWVHIEVYYEKDKNDGHVIVWQDGVKLFDITGYPTVLSDGSLYYSVNHYTDSISPDVSSIYIDDVAISYSPVGH